jgi:signal transduction histidine kinase
MVPLSSRRREVIPYAILLAALAVTAVAARYAYFTAAREDQLRFETTAESVRATIDSRINAFIAMLLGGAGLFAASDDVTREEFGSYVERLEVRHRYPGIQGIGFSRRVMADDRDAVLSSIKREVPDFRFWPEGHGADLHAVVYLEPADERNRMALGYDMASEEKRAEAMGRARDLGEPVATAKVRLIQDGDNPTAQAGFLIYVPVYQGGTVPSSVEQRRHALIGFVYSPFRADDWLHGIVELAGASTVAFEIFDGPETTESNLIHRSRAGQSDRQFELLRTIETAKRPWTLRLYAGESMRAAASRTMVAVISVSGITLSCLLFAVIRGQVRARYAAERTAEELRRSEEKLRAADRAKDEFLATVSHELRTPLNAIVGWASMLARGAIPKEMHPHAITVISRNAAAQARLVEDLLDMSRVVGGHLRLLLADVDPAVLLQSAAEAFRPAAEENGLTLQLEIASGLGTIQADAGRLQQIVTNLLSNALKFTPRGGTVTVRAERVGDVIVITVKDTGIGMDPEFVPFVFERFRQADSSTTRSHPGAGLGLAIARHLVQLHGGSIEAASGGPGRGATFTARVPVQLQPRR